MAAAGTPTHARRRVFAAEPAVANGILAALLATEYKRLLPRLEHVRLKRGEVIYRADQKVAHVYFPEDAVVAMVDTTSDRRTVEVGIIGHEGLVGINIFLASYRFKRPVLEVCRATLPFMAILGIGVLVITYVPWLTTGLLGWLGRL